MDLLVAPFIYTCFVTLFNFGLTLASAARLLMLTAAVIGTIGWARVSGILLSGRLALLLSSIPSLLFVLNNEMFDQFASGDPFVFAAVPWLFVMALHLHLQPDSWRSNLAFFGFGFACGVLYWIKFSSLFLSMSVLLSSGLVLLATDRLPRQIPKLALLALGCLVPIVILWTLSQS